MSIKTNGAEFKRFYSDTAFWPEGMWHDDEVIFVDGVQDDDCDLVDVPDVAKLRIDGGYVLDKDGGDVSSLTAHFNKWKKAQTETCVVVSVEKSKLPELMAAVKALGGSVQP